MKLMLRNLASAGVAPAAGSTRAAAAPLGGLRDLLESFEFPAKTINSKIAVSNRDLYVTVSQQQHLSFVW